MPQLELFEQVQQVLPIPLELHDENLRLLELYREPYKIIDRGKIFP
jgi:hypothetical protein